MSEPTVQRREILTLDHVKVHFGGVRAVDDVSLFIFHQANLFMLQHLRRRMKIREERFAVLEAFEAGIALLGHEVKSLRDGKISIEEGLIRIEKGEIFLWNVHIPPYKYLSHVEYQPTRTRKLLMHRAEIAKLGSQA